jgi:mannose-6-phosphate isomerase-like protein (cupin superfamily)
LLENGNLVDTAKGEKIPDGAKIMPVTNAEQVAAMTIPSIEQLQDCCVAQGELEPAFIAPGVAALDLIAPAAKINWKHDFTISRRSIDSGAHHPDYEYAGAEVLFIHSGQLTIEAAGHTLMAGPGDTVTIPKNTSRSYSNTNGEVVDFVVVQGHI